MLRVGLTGGVACGKSTVGEMLAARGAHFLQADTLAHRLYAPGEPIYHAVVERFGREILNCDGTIDRKRLANAAFPDRVGELNAIVHPAVVAAQNRWMDEVAQSDPDGIAVIEAALIIEAGAAKDFDKLIVVTCDFEQKVARYAHARQDLAGRGPRRGFATQRRSASRHREGEHARLRHRQLRNAGSQLTRQRGRALGPAAGTCAAQPH